MDSTQHTNTEKCRAVIRQLLARDNINVTELARRIHLPQPTIHRLLTGKTEDPKLSTLSLIANYFLISIDQLLGHTPLSPTADAQSVTPLLVPLLTWQEAINYETSIAAPASSNSKKWILIDGKAGQSTFALSSKRSMEPRFPTDSVFIVDPSIQHSNGDLIVIHYPNTSEATIRELVLDGPKQALISITDNTHSETLTNDIKIIGVITQSRYYYK